MNGKSLMQRLIDAGFTKEDMFHHESDLYVYETSLSSRIIKDWCAENGFLMEWACPEFQNARDGALMYDCAFCYEKDLMELDT